jgi:hypothetical protein
MKVFISWSGERSRVVAEALRSWLPDLIQAVKPWVSGVDIRAGMRWSREVDEQLRETQFGILCLTRDNQTAPWLVFEAGALAKSVEGAAVCPYLIDLAPSELHNGPLTAFQAKRADREDTFDMVVAINAALPVVEQLTEVQLQKAFARWWPDLESVLTGLPSHPAPIKRRTSEEVADELLSSMRQIGRQMSEALAMLSSGAGPRPAARSILHLRITGEPAKIDELLSEMQRGEHGVRILQGQRYSSTVAAVNVASDAPDDSFDHDRLYARAGVLGLSVKANLMSE